MHASIMDYSRNAAVPVGALWLNGWGIVTKWLRHCDQAVGALIIATRQQVHCDWGIQIEGHSDHIPSILVSYIPTKCHLPLTTRHQTRSPVHQVRFLCSELCRPVSPVIYCICWEHKQSNQGQFLLPLSTRLGPWRLSDAHYIQLVQEGGYTGHPIAASRHHVHNAEQRRCVPLSAVLIPLSDCDTVWKSRLIPAWTTDFLLAQRFHPICVFPEGSFLSSSLSAS